MKAAFTIIFLTVLLGTNSLKAQNFAWAKQMGGTTIDEGISIAVDGLGNVYTTGYFTGTADFDPGIATYNLTTVGNTDIFIQKLDANGNFLWAKQIGGFANDNSTAIAVDALGNVYITGSFSNTADFDPGVAVFNLTPVGGSDIFVQKLDANGNFLWVVQMGGTSNERGNSIIVDVFGNVYTTGFFYGTSDFDPGTSTYNLTAAPGGFPDIFVQKMDMSGNFVWAKQMGGTAIDQALSIATDHFGNVYTTGYFRGTADFDPGTATYNLTSLGNEDIFIQKMDSSGNFIWAKQIGGSGQDNSNSLVTDALGNIYTTGFFSGTVDFDPGTATYNLTSVGSSDIFVQKMDAAGNFVWAKQMGGTGLEISNSIATDGLGYIYITGYFNGTADFDPDASVFNLTSAGLSDVFVQKMDTAGNFIWAKQIGGLNHEYGNSIAADTFSNVYITGSFLGTVDFDPNASTFSLTSEGNRDIFVAKLSPEPLSLKLLSFDALRTNSTTHLTWKTASESNLNTYEVERSFDAKEFTTITNVKPYNGLAQTYTYDDKIEFTGNIYYRIKAIENDGKFTYSNVITITNNTNRDIEIYPNPTKNTVTVSVKDNSLLNTPAVILNSKGSVVFKQTIESNSQSINTATLSQGIYFIRFANGEVQKLIKE